MASPMRRPLSVRARLGVHLAGLLVLALLPPLLTLIGEPFYVTLATRMLILALAAVSLDLILGYGGMVSFGHAAFVGVGGYVTGILAHHAFMGEPLALFGLAVPGMNEALVVWPLAMAVSALAALVIGVLSLRTGGVHFIMITLAFAQMLYFLMVSLEAYGGDDGLMLWGRNTLAGADVLGNRTLFYYLCLGLLAAVLLALRRLVDSRFGLVLQGARQNERRMRALGFPVTRYRLAAFTLAGAIAGLAGALSVNHAEFASPTLLHWTHSGELLVIVILGGMGTLVGPVLGALAFVGLEEALSGLMEHWRVVFGPLLILVVLFARSGLHGWLIGRRPMGRTRP
ncbi:branched-chain amino acid ABC transporter permease [Rhodospira trueperi]|uniref:Branched-chain amino acid transport system permease protein n=1 Tax=Rhodospira trueperi TaxID=69960 RepID=A0A1G6Z9J3_9PROT|nr:branched-chain amino acid ABC transporter permease [Rhodospira trueperi]SDD99142.1 branched-chain amino acid transport system permease protein [Rhodospira trueperi]